MYTHKRRAFYPILGTVILVIFIFIFVSNAMSNNTLAADRAIDTKIPAIKLPYSNHIYEMLPFVIMDENSIEKLNFPRLADEYRPDVNISSNSSFSIEFDQKPREVNAFAIDYDADTTEVTPLTKLGKNEFGVGSLYGTRTIEVRAIFEDDRYITYTCLAKIQEPQEQNNGAPGEVSPEMFA